MDNAVDQGYKRYSTAYYNLFFTLLEPNLSYNASYSERALEELYATISLTRGLVRKREKIISANAIIDGPGFEKLRSLKQQFSAENSSTANNLWTIAGYAIMVVLLLVILMLFLYQYRPNIFDDNIKLTFLFFNLLLMVGASTTIIKFDAAYIYALPICVFL